jgi:hypothetical protein
VRRVSTVTNSRRKYAPDIEMDLLLVHLTADCTAQTRGIHIEPAVRHGSVTLIRRGDRRTRQRSG